jgi:hypothetical protein
MACQKQQVIKQLFAFQVHRGLNTASQDHWRVLSDWPTHPDSGGSDHKKRNLQTISNLE